MLRFHVFIEILIFNDNKQKMLCLICLIFLNLLY